MKRLAYTFAFALLTCVAIPGCGGSGETTNVAEDMDQTEMEKYEESLKADEAAMSGMDLDAE